VPGFSERQPSLSATRGLWYRRQVVWLFDRDGEKIRYEVCRNEEGPGFLLVMSSSAGHKRVDRIEDATELIERCTTQMRQLQDDGWKVG